MTQEINRRTVSRMTMTADGFKTRLDWWLWANRTTADQFAKRLKVHYSLVSRYRTGARLPTDEHKAQIAKLTAGAVSEKDWR